MFADFKLNEITRNKLEKPQWSEKISRWHQLDDESFAVAEAVYQNENFIENPDIVYFTSAAGSTPTDSLFTLSEKFSPSHFVHTLPNVRALSFSLIKNWEGPMLCTSYGTESFSRAIVEASRYLMACNKLNAIVVNVMKSSSSVYVDLCKISKVAEQDWSLATTEVKRGDSMTDSQLRKDILSKKDLYLSNILLRKN